MVSTPMPAHVFVVGSYVQACCWFAERLPGTGESLLATALRVEPGGKGLNVAVGLQRLGCKVSLLVACGEDDAGDRLMALLNEEGMDAQHVVRLPGHSGMGSGHIASNGENQIVVFPGANALLDATHARRAQAHMASAHIVYGQLEATDEAVAESFAIAHAAGAMTALNLSPWRYPDEQIRATTQVLIVNRHEAAQLFHACGVSAPTSFAQWCHAGHWRDALMAVQTHWPALLQWQITLGEQGGLGFVRTSLSEAWSAVACEGYVCAPVDAVGAGDAFAAAYVANLAQGADVAAAMQRAHRCAAHVVSGVGVLEWLAGSHQLSAWTQARDLPVVCAL